VSRGVIERVAREKRPLLTSNAQNENWLSGRESVVFLGLRSVLCVPLMLKGEVIGLIYVDNRVQAGIFTSDDLELLSAIAASAAVAIENARLYQVAVEKGRLERELQLAHEVQTRLLPSSTPQLEGWEFAAEWIPAREAAGDFYDFIPAEDGRLILVIADVSDKGMAAALYMALTRSIIRASMHHHPFPAEAIAEANRLICTDADYGMFVTLFYALLDPKNGEITYVNAGHNPPLHCDGSCRELARLTRTGMALGIFEDAPYEQRTIRLEPGDFLLLYTDGVTEAFNPAEEQFGEGRLEAVLQSHAHASADELVAAIQQAVEAFTGAVAPFDDVTMVAVRRRQG
jgi:sigma-B regulation protein RsbU (phosphoserine phosphatase)